jgi:hypothetical protein
VPRFRTPFYDGGGSPALRAQLAVLRRFVESLPLARLHPDDGFVVGGPGGWRALAAEGEAYAAWFPGDGPLDVKLALPAGEWLYEWVDVLTGAVTSRTARHESWVTSVRGERRGGGAALRVLRVGPGPAGEPAPR